MECVASESGGDAAGLHRAGSVISGARGQAAKRQLPLPCTLFGALTTQRIYLGNEARLSAGLTSHRAVSVRVPVGCHQRGLSWRETGGSFPSETIKQHISHLFCCCFSQQQWDASPPLPAASFVTSPLAAEQIPVCQEEPLCRLPSCLPFLPCCTMGKLTSSW